MPFSFYNRGEIKLKPAFYRFLEYEKESIPLPGKNGE